MAQCLRQSVSCVFGFDGQKVYWIYVAEELSVQVLEGNETFEGTVTGLEVAVNDNRVAIGLV